MTVLLTISCLAAAGRTVAAPAARRAATTEMQIQGVPGKILRTELHVPENPAQPHGRQLTLVGLILAADDPRPEPDPVLVFQGGPGQSATSLASFYAEFFARVRKRRDILLLDQRGTGLSAPLAVKVPADRMLDDLGAIVPASWPPAMLDSLRGSADLAQYTTRRITDDATRWLDALGYRLVNLYGTSYGSRCALDFLRRHPRRVRTMIIKNPLPMSGIVPLSYAANAQRALDLLLADVQADSAANLQYPALGARVGELLARLEASPKVVALTNPATGLQQRVPLTRAGVAMTLRMMLMAPQSRAQIPSVFARAAQDSFDGLATQMLGLRMAYARTLALGMSLSVVAAEDCPRLTPERIRRDTTGTFLRGAAVEQFASACRIWPRGAVDRSFFAPVRSDVPAVVVSGRLDPATPPAWGEEIARGLPHGIHLVFPFAAHPAAGYDGLDEIAADFIAAGTTAGLDTTRVGGAPLPFPPEP